MYSTTLRTFAIAVAFVARHVLAAELTVLTPVLVQCQNSTVTFSGGQPSYLVSVVPSDDPCSDSIVDIPQTTHQSVEFLVTIPSGTQVEIVVNSADDQEGWSATTIVQPGKDNSCLSKGSNVSSSSSSAPQSSSASSSVSAVAASGTSGASSSSSGAGSDSSSADPFAAPPPAVQSGTIGSTPGSSDGSVNVGSDPNNSTSGVVPRAVLSVGSLIASTLFVFVASQL